MGSVLKNSPQLIIISCHLLENITFKTNMNKLALRKYMKSMIYKKIKNKTQTNELQDKLIYLTKNKII